MAAGPFKGSILTRARLAALRAATAATGLVDAGDCVAAADAAVAAAAALLPDAPPWRVVTQSLRFVCAACGDRTTATHTWAVGCGGHVVDVTWHANAREWAEGPCGRCSLRCLS